MLFSVGSGGDFLIGILDEGFLRITVTEVWICAEIKKIYNFQFIDLVYYFLSNLVVI